MIGLVSLQEGDNREAPTQKMPCEERVRRKQQLGRPASRTVNKISLSHPACGILSWQP